MTTMRGRPREFDRDEVLERAMQVFWERGYEATPISELVAELGIGRQSLYGAFGDKRQLFEEALQRYGECELAPRVAILKRPGSGLANVRDLLHHLLEKGIANDFKGCLVGHTAAEFGLRDPELAEKLSKNFCRMEEAIAEALTRAREAGELSIEKSPRKLARLIVTTVQGLALWGPVHKSPAYMRDVIESLEQQLE